MSYELQQRGRASIDFLVTLQRESSALEEPPSALGIAVGDDFVHPEPGAQLGFDAMEDGNCGKVILDWE